MLSTRSLQFFELPQSFGYDPNSNRSSQIQNGTPSIYQINAANNRIDSISGFARNYTYKATGQTTAITGGAADLISESRFETPLRNLNLTYDSFNRLNGVTGQNLSATYKIAATNMRVEKNANSKVTKFVYGLGGQLLFERDSNTTRDTQHLYFQGEPIGIVRNSSLYFVIPDHLGRPEMMMDSTAAAITVWRAVLTAFDRQSIPINTIGGYHIGFPGQYHDEETGFAHNVNRDYDPATGRYLQSDPIGLAGALDTYGYVGGNPVSLVDPLGLWGFGVLGGGAAEVGAGFLGAGAAGSIGGGFFADGISDAHLGGFAGGGVFSAGPTGATTWSNPQKPSQYSDVGALGAFAGFGGGFFATNATCVDQIGGVGDTTTLNIGIGPLRLSIQHTSAYVNYVRVWTTSITFGPAAGLSGSNYPTNTTVTGPIRVN